jgi:hypothetical protein
MARKILRTLTRYPSIYTTVPDVSTAGIMKKSRTQTKYTKYLPRTVRLRYCAAVIWKGSASDIKHDPCRMAEIYEKP